MPDNKNISMFYGAKPIIFERARLLRNQMTNSELLVWEILKGNKILGYRFRRQHPMDMFIADFYCHPLKLVIEIDGGIHRLEEQHDYDIGREEELEQFGIKVIRFTNKEVEDNIEAVRNKITKECKLREKEIRN